MPKRGPLGFEQRDPSKNEYFPTDISIHDSECIGCQTWNKEIMISATVPDKEGIVTFMDMFLDRKSTKDFFESVIYHISLKDFNMTKNVIKKMIRHLPANQCAELAGIITKAGFEKI